MLHTKDVEKGAMASNVRFITCLPLTWKPLTGRRSFTRIWIHIIRYQLSRKGLGKEVIKDQLLIDKMVIRNCKMRLTRLGVASIDFRKLMT